MASLSGFVYDKPVDDENIVYIDKDAYDQVLL